jgi:hypothetical protein
MSSVRDTIGTHSSRIVGDPSEGHTTSRGDGYRISPDWIGLSLFERRIDIGVIGGHVKGFVDDLELMSGFVSLAELSDLP